MSNRCPACGAEDDEKHTIECEYIGNSSSRSYQEAIQFVLKCIDDGLEAGVPIGKARHDLVLARIKRIRDRIARQ